MCQCLSLPNYHPYGEAWQCKHALGTARTTRLVRDMEKPNPSPPLCFCPWYSLCHAIPPCVFLSFFMFGHWGLWEIAMPHGEFDNQKISRGLCFSATLRPLSDLIKTRCFSAVEAFQNRPGKFDLNSLGGPYVALNCLMTLMYRTCLSHSSCIYMILNGSADVKYVTLRKCHWSGNVWIPTAFVAIRDPFEKKSIMAAHLARWWNLWAEEEIWWQVSGTVWDIVYGYIARQDAFTGLTMNFAN